MACGIPVVLSDIVQHQEIYEADSGIGYLFKLNDGEDLINGMDQIYTSGKAEEQGRIACETAHMYFSAPKMSKQYQDVYQSIAGRKDRG